MTLRAVTVLCLLGTAFGCWSDDSNRSSKPASIPGRTGNQHAVLDRSGATTLEGDDDDSDNAPSAPRTFTVDVPGETTPTTTDAPAPERDLDEELRVQFGVPSHCFSSRAAADMPDVLVLNVDVTVTENGLVTRADASGSGLSAEEARCVQGIASRVRLKAPIDDAPRAVRATVELRQRPQPPAPTPTPTAAPQPTPGTIADVDEPLPPVAAEIRRDELVRPSNDDAWPPARPPVAAEIRPEESAP